VKSAEGMKKSHGFKITAFCAAGEAKISFLKRKHSFDRSGYRGFAKTKGWVGFGLLNMQTVLY